MEHNEMDIMNKETKKLREAYRLVFKNVRNQHNETMQEFSELSKRLSTLSVKMDELLKFMEEYTK